MIRNIIFDWSGTLVDDLPAVLKASNFVLTQAGKAEMSLEQFRAEFSLPFTKFYDRHTPDVPMPQLEEWFHADFRRAQDSVIELPHAREFLEFCRAKKLRTFLLSTIHPDHFDAQCRITGFDAFLDKPYTDVWDKRKKIHEILAENHLQPDETLFIGDMEHDIETAKHGGIHSCAVLTGYNTLEQLRAARPDLIVEHLGELRGILEQNDLHLKPAAEKFEEIQPPLATVGGLIFNAKNEVLMIRTHKWSNLWGIPGGKIKWGETSEAALRREILEETGLKIFGHPVCARAGLHPLEGILPRRAFCSAELHLPLRRQKPAREIERRRPRIPLGQTRRGQEIEIEQADEGFARSGW